MSQLSMARHVAPKKSSHMSEHSKHRESRPFTIRIPVSSMLFAGVFI